MHTIYMCGEAGEAGEASMAMNPAYSEKGEPT